MASIAVRRLPRDAGPAGWACLLPAAPPPRPLDRHVRAEWLVIGAGFAGLAAARRLSQLCAGDRVVILDARRVGEGPAGRNSGFMIDLPHDLSSESYGGDSSADARQIRLNRAAIDFARGAVSEYAMSAEAFAESGKVNAAAGERGLAHNRAYARHLDRLDEPYRLLDAADMRALTGTGYYAGGLFTPGTAMIQPALFVRGLASALGRRNSIAVHESSPVTALEREGDHWRAVTPAGSVSAERVILAVNGHAQSFGFYPRRLIHIGLYASMTRALTAEEVRRLGGEPAWGCTPANPMGTTVRRVSGTGGPRILVRNRATYAPALTVSEERLARMGRDHDRAFRRRFPMLGDVTMEYRWSGQLCLSWNGVSAFGELDEGLYSACCQNGLGTTRGTVAGMLAAELATGHESELLGLLLEEEAPRKLPPEPFASIGATASIRWGELRAGAEL